MPRAVSTNRCLACLRPEIVVGPFSRRGLCQTCSELRMRQNANQLAAHQGAYFDRWRAAMAASVGAPPPAKRD